MKIISWVMVGFGFVAQVFYSFSPFLLPSMASAEGVAEYPPPVELLLSFSYRVLPFLLFGAALAAVDKHLVKLRSNVYIGVMVSVLSPLLIVVTATVFQIPAGFVRGWIWPTLPVIQLIVFATVAASVWAIRSKRSEAG